MSLHVAKRSGPLGFHLTKKTGSFVRGLAAAGALSLASQAAAEIVQLRSVDGTINLEGNLVGFADDYYLLQTQLGDLRIAANMVRCEGAGCPAVAEVVPDVVIGGSDTIGQGLMPLLLAGYATFADAESQTQTTAAANEYATKLVGGQGFGDELGTFLVRSGTSTDAFDKLLDGGVDVGMSARRVTPSEAAALASSGAGDMVNPGQEHIIAIDGLVVIVNPNNPVRAIRAADLARIYAGEVTNWAQLGGPNLAIDTVTQADAGTSNVFETGIYGRDNVNLSSDYQAQDNVQAALYVEENPGAIAYVGFAFKRGQQAVEIVSECGIGTTPDAFSVKTEEYGLFRRLFLYNRGDLDKNLAEDFVAFANSDDAKNVILQSGFIDLTIERREQSTDGPRATRIRGSGGDATEARLLNDMIGMMGNYDRLSSTFRFRTGSANLDVRGESDLARLADFAETLPRGSEITFVGFADSVGAFGPNLALAENRAAQVKSKLEAIAGNRLAGIQLNVTGFGELAPVGCNTTDAGRSSNRRVETWIKTP